jgi:hypothetical protein
MLSTIESCRLLFAAFYPLNWVYTTIEFNNISMSKHGAIVKQFLLALTDTQKGILREYYRLTTDADLPPDEVVRRVSEIWSLGEEDPKLLSWLECIDFILCDEDDNEQLSDDKRAYLSEYLTREVKLTGNKSLSKVGKCKLGESIGKGKRITFLLGCPNGKGHVFVHLEEMSSSQRSKTLERRSCTECNFKLSEHQIIKDEQIIVI